MPLVYDVKERQIAYRECKAPLKPDQGAIRLEILVDRTSVEIYGNGGRTYMPVGAIPPDDSPSLGIFTRGDDTRLKSLEVYELRSAWDRPESGPPE
ncbi:MAG TPA: GH32 C-terminal domain-containing protein, partial [Sumerlaeia bacterium]|nr:GH32 C-terminal domain-containing protein [Sumerlaeia bacterium]